MDVVNGSMVVEQLFVLVSGAYLGVEAFRGAAFGSIFFESST
jgi:hypothetical protein